MSISTAKRRRSSDLAGSFDRRDGAERHLVIMRVDDGRVGMRLQQRLGDLTALVAGEVAGLAGQDDHIGRLRLDRVVEALLAVVSGRSANRAFELDDLALAAGLLDCPIGDPLTFLHEVRADEGEEVDAGLGELRVDVAVGQQHRNAGLLGVHDRRNQRFLFARRQEDEIDPLLTTVLLPHFEMGSIAAELLLDAASGSAGRPRQIKVECPIVRRGSV